MRLAALLLCSIALPAVAQDGLVSSPKGEEAAGEEQVVIDDRVPPAEQEDALKLFAATWRCTGTSSTEFGADVPTTFTITGKKDLSGRWLNVKTELVPKAKGAKPVVSSEFWGMSRHAGLVRNGAANDGGFISSKSSGWYGEGRFDWQGTSSHYGVAAKEKLAFEKKSDKELSVMWSIGPVELRVVFEGTCKR